MLVGLVVGLSIPARYWILYDPKLAGLLMLAVATVPVLVSSVLIRVAGLEMPRQGWSISSILVASQARSVISRRLGVIAAWLTGVSMVLFGAMLGLVLTEAYGVHVAPSWHF